MVFLLLAVWIYIGITGLTGSRNAAEKSRSAYNIQINSATISAPIRDNDASTLPQIKATTVLDLSGRQYFIQDSPNVITHGAYTAIYSDY